MQARLEGPLKASDIQQHQTHMHGAWQDSMYGVASGVLRPLRWFADVERIADLFTSSIEMAQES